jgi:septum formation protein
MTLILASGSPRRFELLSMLGVEFVVDVADVDETPLNSETPAALVERLARHKAQTVAARRPGDIVIGADTTVDVDGVSFAKPEDDDEARAMLRALSGRAHLVHTGMAVVGGGMHHHGIDTATVVFAKLSDATIDQYVATGEPMGKAGAYAIQGIGGSLITRLEGNLHTVIGLPTTHLRTLLGEYISNR